MFSGTDRRAGIRSSLVSNSDHEHEQEENQMKSRFLTCCSVTAAILLAGVSGQFPAELLHASAAVSGDVNGDGQTNLTDVRQLVSFLARKTTRLENWQNVDFDGNSVIDASDLSNLKKAIMYVPVVVPEVDPDPAYIHLKGSSPVQRRRSLRPVSITSTARSTTVRSSSISQMKLLTAEPSSCSSTASR